MRRGAQLSFRFVVPFVIVFIASKHGGDGKFAIVFLVVWFGFSAFNGGRFRSRYFTLSDFLQAHVPMRPIRGWRAVAPENSRSYVVWQATRPVIESWLDGRSSKIMRALGSRPMNGQGLGSRSWFMPMSARQEMASLSNVSAGDFAEVSATLAERLSAEQWATVCATGALPDEYWIELGKLTAGLR